MRQVLCVGLGSGLGGGLRYLLDMAALFLGGTVFPLSTLLINLSGSALIGYLAGLWATEGGKTPSANRWHFWVTGFCGGYTTFSTFSWQVLHFVREGEGTLAGAYAAGSVAFGLLAVWLGLSRATRRRAAANATRPE